MKLRIVVVICLTLMLILPAQAQQLPAPDVFQAQSAYRYGYFCADFVLMTNGLNIPGSVGNATGNFGAGGIAVRAYVGNKKPLKYVDDYPQDLRVSTSDWMIVDYDSNSGVVAVYDQAGYYFAQICGLSGNQTVKLRFAGVKVSGKLGKKSPAVKVKIPRFRQSFEDAAQAIGYGKDDRP